MPGRSRKSPQVLFGAPRPDAPADDTTVDRLTDWVASPRNWKFTLTIVNRLWDAALGAPVAGELTSVPPVEECRNPALVRYLVQLMIDLRYDRKAFLRVVLNTKTYQRQATATALGPGEQTDFPGPQLRRMTAEQAWDSLMTLKPADPDATVSKEKPDYSRFKSLAEARTVDKYWAILECEREAARGYVATFLKGLERSGKVRGAGFLADDLKRGNEIGSPATDGHLLRLFGQFGRETTDAAWANPTTPQALALMNGPLLDAVPADDSTLAAAALGPGRIRHKCVRCSWPCPRAAPGGGGRPVPGRAEVHRHRQGHRPEQG